MPSREPISQQSSFRHLTRHAFAVAVLGGLYACGGGGGTEPPPSNNPGAGSPAIPWTAGVFQPSASFRAQCAVPRTGVHPIEGTPWPDVQGSTLAENHWLRSWTNELYLWYSEVSDVNPTGFASTAAYFDVLKTNALTASGAEKDRFHDRLPTNEWLQFAQSGASAGYGVQWVILAALPPRRLVVALTEPSSPASSVNLARGAEVLAVDGVDLVNNNTQAGVDTINAGLFPGGPGETHTFRIRDLGSATPRDVTLQSTVVVTEPVQNVRIIATTAGDVGYMLFNDHIATAEAALIEAIETLDQANVADLVLDIRYNGGGFLDIASQLAYMIAGPVPTAGRTFERIVFNDKHPTTDPVTGQPLAPISFHTTTLGFSQLPGGQPLPTLDLDRVFVLTGPNTCSASESIMNGLRGVDVEVIQIGSTTCGKPYGFYPTDNCGTTYFSIQFQGQNAKGFGEYGDGFSPSNTSAFAGVSLPGCSVRDDFDHGLGEANESRLAAALQYRVSPVCPSPSGIGQFKAFPAEHLRADGVMMRAPWRENRIIRE